MKKYDALIVGGGPVGSYVAREISKKNYNVAVLEKNKEIGIPMNCAGLVTPRVFEIADISKKDVVQNKIKGANIHSPSGNILTIGGDKTYALAINRTIFDKTIARKTKSDFFKDCKVNFIKKSKNHVKIKTNKNSEFKGRLLIGADGPHSLVRETLNFPKPTEFLKGIGAEISNVNLDPCFVEIFLGNKIAPGFFAWVIPTNNQGTEARVGLCIKQNSRKTSKFYFDKFLKNKLTNSFLEDAKIIKKTGGVIPLGVLKKTFNENTILVGDAAAQVKPTSGGGIYSGLLCAKYCADVSIDALEKNDTSSNFLKSYQKLWKKNFGREFSYGMGFRSIYKKLTDKQFEKYIQNFQNPKIIEIINKYGDIDYPSKLLKPLIKGFPLLLKPSFRRY